MLDIGIGFGKYGVLAREYLELWDSNVSYGKWLRQIDGIEVYEGYITPLHRYIYDNLYIGNVNTILKDLDEYYDLIIMIDVIEHFEEDVGSNIIKYCIGKTRNLLVATPKKPCQQGAVFGNEHETHRSVWKPDKMANGQHYFTLSTSNSWIVLIGEDAVRIRRWYWYEKIFRISPLLAQIMLKIFRFGLRR